MQQADDGAGSQQSGVSRQLDFSITEEILRAYGSIVKDAMRNVMCAISEVRQDRLTVDVAGMDEFDITEFGTDVQDAQSLLNLGVGSSTLKRQIFKRIALKYLADSRQEIKNQIMAEIDAAVENK
jgi:hypothetical protein